MSEHEDLIAGGLGEAIETLFQTASMTIQYVRSGHEDVELLAIRGKTNMAGQDEDGLGVVEQTADWIVRVDDWPPELEAPLPGDVIQWNGRKFVVLEQAGQGWYEWADSYCNTLRIHTREIGEA